LEKLYERTILKSLSASPFIPLMKGRLLKIIMDIENKIEQELVFKIEVETQNRKQKVKKRRVIKVASENLKKMVIDRLGGKTGEC